MPPKSNDASVSRERKRILNGLNLGRGVTSQRERSFLIKNNLMGLNTGRVNNNTPRPVVPADSNENAPKLPSNASNASNSGTRKRSSADKAKKNREAFLEIGRRVRNDLRKRRTVQGSCCSPNCEKLAVYRLASSLQPVLFCKKHAKRETSKHVDLVDSLGLSIQRAGKGKVLVLFKDFWTFLGRSELGRHNLIPGSPSRCKVAFHADLMQDAYDLSRIGTAAVTICDLIKARYTVLPKRKFYKPFLNALREYTCWMIKETCLVDSNVNHQRSDYKYGYRCPACFGNPETSKSIILVKL